jgi:hypothetical protein
MVKITGRLNDPIANDLMTKQDDKELFKNSLAQFA